VGGKNLDSSHNQKVLITGFLFGKYKSMNDAITSILMGRLNALNSWRKFRHGRLDLRAKQRVGVAIQLRLSIKIDAPLAQPYPKTQKPHRKEAGRANDFAIAVAARTWPATFLDLYLSSSLLIPQSPICRQPRWRSSMLLVRVNRKVRARKSRNQKRKEKNFTGRVGE
jgi:hypothetical protein